MTDFEMTTLCAKAMGLVQDDECPEWVSWTDADGQTREAIWDPLGDDAQAMAMVKRLGLVCDPQHDGQNFAKNPGWEVWRSDPREMAISPDLNRAIVECVANIYSAEHLTPTA